MLAMHMFFMVPNPTTGVSKYSTYTLSKAVTTNPGAGDSVLRGGRYVYVGPSNQSPRSRRSNNYRSQSIMPARTAPTSVVLSSYTQPMQSGYKNKTVKLQAGLSSFANIGNSAATTDTITVDADYGIYDTTVAQNCTTEATNFRDPA